MCSLCKSQNHLAINCHYNWGRRTRAQRTPQRMEEPTPFDIDHTNGDQEQSEDSNNGGTDRDSEIENEKPLYSDEHSEGMGQKDPESPSIEEFTSSDTNV